MRLSADPHSPHWRVDAVFAKVFLDGAEQRYVYEADEERGIIRRLKLDRAGEPMVNDMGDGFAEETVTGAVRIEIEDSYSL